jgi:hypothetical protein
MSYELPEEIAAGIDEVAQRVDWNRPAPEEYALPMETWREVVARRHRHQEVRAKLATGEVQDINDLITLNLDIYQFAEDVIVQSEGPELVRAFWHALQRVSVLDPACGSGAFLFAALNILEMLYTACLEGMQGFLDDLQWSQRPHHPDALRDFSAVLEQVHQHPNRRYYVLKSIVINNLYGVDIIEEAVEICKLRLFLKLVAQLESYEQIEPLPDIDFNIRAGNTLVGFTSLDAVRQAMTVAPDGNYRMLDEEQQKTVRRVNEDAEIADAAFNRFREQQTTYGGEITADDKAELRSRLNKLRAELNRYLAAEYGIDLKDTAAYEKWEASHQPFHWFVEFYGIMQRGGFDVIIGNPPYVEYSKVRSQYTLRGVKSLGCGNLYAFFTERSYDLSRAQGRFGFIVQAPIVSTERMAPLRDDLQRRSNYLVFSTYDDRPSKLFSGMHHCRVSIILSRTSTSNENPVLATTRYHKWYEEERPFLFSNICYYPLAELPEKAIVPKIRSATELKIYKKVLSMPSRIGTLISSHSTDFKIYFKITGVGHWFTFTTVPPKFYRDGVLDASTRQDNVSFNDERLRNTVFCLLWSTLHYWIYQVRTNCRDFNPSDLRFLPIPNSLTKGLDNFCGMAQAITRRLEETSGFSNVSHTLTGAISYQNFRPKLLKQQFDAIDQVLAEHYGFTDEELDFIINYDIKYRMGRYGGEENEN